MGSLIIAGIALATIGFLGRALTKAAKPGQAGAASKFLNSTLFSSSGYYKGGFEPVMTKREAGLILGISPSNEATKVKQAHKRIMLLNHPDRGGSPYLASKINEAKDVIEKKSYQ
ncbi:Mitochondrial import inner membrane translocase subunit TIM14, partial [Fragariocoptes setiger]